MTDYYRWLFWLAVVVWFAAFFTVAMCTHH